MTQKKMRKAVLRAINRAKELNKIVWAGQIWAAVVRRCIKGRASLEN